MTAPQVVDARTGPARVRFDEAASSMLRTIKAIENHPTLTAAAAACIEKHYMALGTRSIQVDDNTDDRLTAMSIKTGRTPGELVAIFVKSAPLVDPAPAADGPGERPDGVGEVAQATPTPSPAVTDALALVGLPAPCDQCGERSEHEVCS